MVFCFPVAKKPGLVTSYWSMELNTSLFCCCFCYLFRPTHPRIFCIFGHAWSSGKKRQKGKQDAGSTESRAEWGGFLSSLPECIDLGTFAYNIHTFTHTHTLAPKHKESTTTHSPIHGINELSVPGPGPGPEEVCP